MNVNESEGINEIINKIRSTNDLRLINFIRNSVCMRSNGANDSSLYKSKYNSSKEVYISDIKKYLLKIHPGAALSYLLERYDSAMKNFIPIDRFTWIAKNPIAIKYFWGFLKLQNHHNKYIDSFEFYGDYTVDKIPNPDEISQYCYILDYFDCNFISDGEKGARFLNEIAKEYHCQFNSVKLPMFFMENSNGNFEWIWAYLSKIKSDSEYESLSKNKFSLILSLFHGSFKSLKKEQYAIIMAIFMLWDGDLIQKKYLISNMSKAWSQAKLRREREGKLALSFYIDKKSKDKILEISKLLNLPINKTIEELIDVYYKKYTDVLTKKESE